MLFEWNIVYSGGEKKKKKRKERKEWKARIDHLKYSRMRVSSFVSIIHASVLLLLFFHSSSKFPSAVALNGKESRSWKGWKKNSLEREFLFFLFLSLSLSLLHLYSHETIPPFLVLIFEDPRMECSTLSEQRLELDINLPLRSLSFAASGFPGIFAF